jgi:hypothetical protein
MKTILSLTATLCALLVVGCAIPTAEGPEGEEGSPTQAEESKTSPVEAAPLEVAHPRSDETLAPECTAAQRRNCPADTVCIILLDGRPACAPE